MPAKLGNSRARPLSLTQAVLVDRRLAGGRRVPLTDMRKGRGGTLSVGADGPLLAVARRSPGESEMTLGPKRRRKSTL